MQDIQSEFTSFSAPLIGLPLSHLWQGYGSAIFLEFGRTETGQRRDGSHRNPRGEWTLMIELGWRIECKRLIWCGSSSDSARWPRAFRRIEGARVVSVSLWGRLAEIELTLSNGLRVLSMMTAEGDPEWGLIKRGADPLQSTSVCIRAGRLRFDMRP
jgi:hypothetical protein